MVRRPRRHTDRDGALADFAERVAEYQEQYKVGVVTDSRRNIRFIDSRYKELFTVKDGGDVYLKLDDGELLVRPCRYIGEYHTKIGSNTYHICEFAERMEQAGTTYTPQPPGMSLELPERCYSTLPSSGDLILILRGDSQQHPVSYSASDPEQNRRMADQYNGLLGVTKAQEAAMLGGALFGWDAPAADPRSYDEQGKPYKPSRRQGRSNPETDRGR